VDPFFFVEYLKVIITNFPKLIKEILIHTTRWKNLGNVV